MYFNEACMNHPAIVFLIDPETGEIVSANKKAEKIYGYSIDKLCTMNISEINALKEKQIKEEINNASCQNFNIFLSPHKTATNKILTVLIESYPTQINNKKYLFSTIYPTNERNIFPIDVHKLMLNSTDAIMVINQQNQVIKINKKFEDLFGCIEKNSVGEDSHNLITTTHQQKYKNLIEKLSIGKSEKVSYISDLGNTSSDYMFSGIPIFYLNNYLGSIISIKEVLCEKDSDTKENPEKSDTIRKSNKDDFLASMSHDMRTPMNAILGLANFGLEEIKVPKAIKYFSQIKESSEYLLALINDILDMQKLETGEIDIEEIITFTPLIAQKVRTIIEPRAAEKNINLELKLECEDLYKYVKADEKRIEQILINILNNAIKYTPNGGSVKWYDFVEEKRDDGILIITHEITDTGVGISEDFQKVMFDPFTTEVNSQSRSEGGSGLGLAITKNLIQTMGGTISCQSELGKGTKFIIKLYLNSATQEDINQFLNKSKCQLNPYILKGKKILVCEDVEINILIIKKLLSIYECTIDVAKNGLEGVVLARNNKYFAILMDIRMPVMNGLDAAKEIRKSDVTTPIIALSANAFSKDIEKSLAAGMNAHLSKPINREELFSKLASFIDK